MRAKGAKAWLNYTFGHRMSVGLVELIERVAPSVCGELFSSCGVPLRRRFSPIPPAAALGSRVAGVIDLRGERVRGTVVLVAGFRLLASCTPQSAKHARPLSDAFASDWLLVRDRASELAAGLLDRARMRTISYGEPWQAGPARAISGAALEATVRRRKTRPIAFDAPNDVVLVWLDLEGPPASVRPPFPGAPISVPRPPPLRAPMLSSFVSMIQASRPGL
jgi:hypothetical protein